MLGDNHASHVQNLENHNETQGQSTAREGFFPHYSCVCSTFGAIPWWRQYEGDE